MLVAAAASHHTACSRVGRNGDRVTDCVKVRYIVTSFCHRERERCIGGNHHAALRPVSEGIALIGRGRQRSRFSVEVDTCARNITARNRIGRSRDGVTVEAEAGHIVAGSRHRERVGRVGGNLHAVLRPSDESIAFVGRGRQRGRSTVVVGTGTGHHTTRIRVGSNGDFIAVETEVGLIVASAHDHERVGGVVGDNRTILLPVDKGVALVSRGRQRGGGEMLVTAAASHHTACNRVSRNGDGVADCVEVRHIIGVSVHRERIGRVGGNLHAVLRPVDEFITHVGSGRQCGRGEVFVIATAIHYTACSRVGRNVDGMDDGVEVRHKGGIFRHRERVSRIGGNLHATLRPVDEFVTRVGFGLQRGHFSVVVNNWISTHNITTFDRIHRGHDSIAVEQEVRHVVAGSRHRERVGQVGGDLHATLRPVDESIALVGRGRQRGRFSVVVCACAANSSSSDRVGSGRDFIAVEAEVRHVVASFRHRERVGRVGGDERTALFPAHKGITFVGRGGQRGHGEMFVTAAAGHHTACDRICRNSDGITDGVEVRHVGGIFRHCERVGRVGGNLRTALRPVDEFIARVGRGSQRGRGEMLVTAAAEHITAYRRIARSGDGVADGVEVGDQSNIFRNRERVGGIG